MILGESNRKESNCIATETTIYDIIGLSISMLYDKKNLTCALVKIHKLTDNIKEQFRNKQFLWYIQYFNGLVLYFSLFYILMPCLCSFTGMLLAMCIWFKYFIYSSIYIIYIVSSNSLSFLDNFVESIKADI